MKRFVLFGGMTHYPAGGFDDLIGTEDTLEEAKKTLEGLLLQYANSDDGRRLEWSQIVDMTTGEVVLRDPVCADENVQERWREFSPKYNLMYDPEEKKLVQTYKKPWFDED